MYDFDEKFSFCDMFASYINFLPFIKVLRDEYYQSRLLILSKNKNRTGTTTKNLFDLTETAWRKHTRILTECTEALNLKRGNCIITMQIF